MMPASHPSHTLWKSLWDSHIPTASTPGWDACQNDLTVSRRWDFHNPYRFDIEERDGRWLIVAFRE
jgi:hypothetical protein